MSNLEKIFKESKGSAEEYARLYTENLIEVLRKIDHKAVGEVIACFQVARSKGATIFFLGNGGSAATAAHFANDLGVCASPEGKISFRSHSLTSNTPFITCLANDFGYEEIFVRQLKNLMIPGDVVVGISASGNSPNAVKALKYAAEHGGVPVALVGFDGGQMKKLARHCIHVEAPRGDYGPVEDVHMVLDHLISTFLALE
jgi:D-sedoheptulose 7-phosphate isomerase